MFFCCRCMIDDKKIITVTSVTTIKEKGLIAAILVRATVIEFLSYAVFLAGNSRKNMLRSCNGNNNSTCRCGYCYCNSYDRYINQNTNNDGIMMNDCRPIRHYHLRRRIGTIGMITTIVGIMFVITTNQFAVVVHAFTSTNSISSTSLASLYSSSFYQQQQQQQQQMQHQYSLFVSSSSVQDESNTTTTIIPASTDFDEALLEAAATSAAALAAAINTTSSDSTIDCEEGSTSEECIIGTEEIFGECIPERLVTLPTHTTSAQVNRVLQNTEHILRNMHINSTNVQEMSNILRAKEVGRTHEYIYANNYVDLGKIDTVGFDFDYTLVTYTDELLELIYEKALQRLVSDRQYPIEMTQTGLLKYDPLFSIRGLAVDKETGWITHLSYTHKVAVAWEGREKLPTSRIFAEYRGKRALTPNDRKKRLKPLNDLFSMAECCLIADAIQFFKERDIPYCPQNVVTDVLNSVTATHLSGDFHRMVAQNPERYFDPTPHLKDVLRKLKESGKRLIFVSNSPFWYVDAGMRYVFGSKWRLEWDAIITSAGKPNFYTDETRPFREVCQETRRLNFKLVTKFEPGQVYAEGCLKEMIRLLDWSATKDRSSSSESKATISDMEEFTGVGDDPLLGTMRSGTHEVATPHTLYIGDSLFADLVDAKREFGWTTAAVTPEVGYEAEIQNQPDFRLTQKSIDLLLHALRRVQDVLGNTMRTEEDMMVLNALESLVSQWRDRETHLLGNPFGSVFRARYQPSLFAHSLKRYCDLYMTSVSSLRHYSPQHRFYPEQNHKLLAHEIAHMRLGDTWALEDELSK